MTNERMSQARTLLHAAGYREDGNNLLFRPADHVDPDFLAEEPTDDDQVNDTILVFDADTGSCVTDGTERFLCYLANSRQTDDQQLTVVTEDVRDVVSLAYSQIGSLFAAFGIQEPYPPAFVQAGTAIYMPFAGAYGDFEMVDDHPTRVRLPAEIYGDAYRAWVDDHVADLRSRPRQPTNFLQPAPATMPGHGLS